MVGKVHCGPGGRLWHWPPDLVQGSMYRALTGGCSASRFDLATPQRCEAIEEPVIAVVMNDPAGATGSS